MDLPEDPNDPHVDPYYVGSVEEMEDDVDDRDMDQDEVDTDVDDDDDDHDDDDHDDDDHDGDDHDDVVPGSSQ